MRSCSTRSERVCSAGAGGCWEWVVPVGRGGQNRFLTAARGRSCSALPETRPDDDERLQGAHGVCAVPTGHRPQLPACGIVRGVPYVETEQKVGNVVITLEQRD
jgi:hypothetical protein